jgi:pyrroline-5-carboxylate reductase
MLPAVEAAAGLNEPAAPPAIAAVEAAEEVVAAVEPQDFREVIREVRNAARDAAMLTRISAIAARLEAFRAAREAEDDDETALLMVM